LCDAMAGRNLQALPVEAAHRHFKRLHS
jgi:hypothetical protein